MEQKQSSDGSPQQHVGSTQSTTGEPPKFWNRKSFLQKPQFQSFWNSLNSEQRKPFLTIRIQDLRDHLTTTMACSERSLLPKDFDEAIACGKTNQKRSNLWEFWVCREEDLLITIPKINSTLNNRWFQLVFNAPWKPVLLSESLKLLQDLHNSDVNDSDKNKKIEWPLLSDVEDDRSTLLGKLQKMFQHLIDRNSLADSNMAGLMKNTQMRVKKLIPKEHHGMQVVTQMMSQTHLPFCFLDAHLLNKIIDTLQCLSKACNSIEDLLDTNRTFRYGLGIEQSIIPEKVSFNDDGTCLVVSEDTVTNDSCLSLTSCIDIWIHLKVCKKSMVKKYQEMCKIAHQLVDSWSKEREELMIEDKILRRIRNMCALEVQRRETIPGYVAKNYDSILMERKEEISQNHDDMAVVAELKAIDMILNEFIVLVLDPNFKFELPSDKESNVLFVKRDASVHARLWENSKRVVLQENQIEAKMARLDRVMKEFARECEETSGVDYRALLLPVIRLFIREKMEKPMKRHVEESSTQTICGFNLHRNYRKCI